MKKKKDATSDLSISQHDGIVKFYLTEKENAVSVFKEYLPAAISQRLDYQSLEIVKDTFIDKKLSRYLSDLLYKVKLDGHNAFIYLLIEHKSVEEPFIAFQLLKYLVRIWELVLKQNKSMKKLPVILPLVLYHGEKKWELESNFLSLFDAPDYLKEYIPNFKYNLQDISHLQDEEIKGSVLLKVLFLTLKYIYSPDLSFKLPGILKLFRELENKTLGTEYLEALLKYLGSSAGNLTMDQLHQTLSQVSDKGGDIMATIAEQWIEKGIEKGLEKGKEETKWDVIKSSLKEGLAIPTISRITGVPVEKINNMKEQLMATS